jgi:CPA2 family monovalent cation:H+ antiporter-2
MPEHTLHLLAELTALVGASAVVAYLGQRFLRVVPLVGFLITGVIIGPHSVGLVSDERLVEGAAEVGVILLLFTIGIEFSLARLARIRRLVLGGGALQVSLTLGGVTTILVGLGISWPAAIYTGCLASLSSTIIALKLLADGGEIGSPHGKAALGVLIFQDMAVVGMVLLLPALAGQGGGWTAVAAALGKAVGIIAVVLILARRAMPLLLERIARACSPDIFLLSLIAICFGTAWLASVAGLGVSLGAFLAGLIVSESSFSEHALSEILPLRILFSVAFFVSIGMLLDPLFVLREPALVVAVVLGVIVLKSIVTTASLLILGLPLGVGLTASFLLAQIGEFAFVLERQGSALGLYPAGSAVEGSQAFIAATVVLMIGTPAFARLGSRLANAMAPRSPVAVAPTDRSWETVSSVEASHGPVLIAGYGAAARNLTRKLPAVGSNLVIMTLSPDGALEAENAGHRVVRGDYLRREILGLAGVERASVLVVADDDLATTERLVAIVRTLWPDLPIVAQIEDAAHEADLREAGATSVVTVEDAAERELARVVLEVVGAARHEEARLPGGVEPGGVGLSLSGKQRLTPKCRHAGDMWTVFPGTERVCPECVAKGERWIHLRVCMSCGYVGCCDSSPGRHSYRHFESTRHPIVRSWEPGEDWAWCYVDQVNL